MLYVIYETVNNVNEKIYVGAHKTNDVNDDYLGSGDLLIKAIKKYGKKNFSKQILAVFDNENDMFEMEAVIVDEDFVLREDTYNLKVGGFGGDSGLTPEGLATLVEHGRRTAELNLGFHNGKRASFLGKTHTDSAKKKMGLKNSIHQKGTGNSQFGTCWVYSLEEKRNKKIKKDNLKHHLNLGWIAGRKMTF